jgi:hypothetical protein
VGLERGPLSQVSTIEELLGRNSSGPGLENREYGRGDPLRWPRDTLYPQKLALTSPTSGGRSVGIVCLRTKATEFVSVLSQELTERIFNCNERHWWLLVWCWKLQSSNKSNVTQIYLRERIIFIPSTAFKWNNSLLENVYIYTVDMLMFCVVSPLK